MRNANTQKGHMEELKGKTLQEEKDLNRFSFESNLCEK
jgi:hypothetical protein